MRLYIIIIGILSMSLSAFATDEESALSHNKVYVEPSFVETTRTESEYKLIPYKERRRQWGSTLSVAYSSYTPENLESSFVGAGIALPYKKTSMPLVELQFVMKRNMAIGSLGGELGLGILQTGASSGSPVDSSLDMKMIRLGGTFMLDMMYDEPLLVPYGSAGLYTVMFKESMGGITYGGNTRVAPYFSGGLMMQLDWIDRTASRVSFHDSGVLSSFAFAEARTLFKSSAEEDPDYSSQVHWNAGVRVEF